MPKGLATHSVVDIDRWLGGKAERRHGVLQPIIAYIEK